MNEKKNNNYLLDFINNELLFNKELSSPIDSKTNLINSGIVDSLGLIKLVSYLEHHHNIKIDDWDVTPDNFQTVDTIHQFIQTMI